MNTMPILDTAGSTHTLTLGPVGIVLNGRPCRLFVRDAQIDLMSSDLDLGVVSVTPAALWYALAGDDPTAEDAGLIQAQALAGFAAMREVAQLTERLRLLLDEIDRHIHHTSQPPLPSYRFSPFVRQLLATLDGSEEQILAVARILKQPPQVICEWSAQLGKNVSLPLTNQSQQPPVSEEQVDEQPVERTVSNAPEEEAEPTGESRRGKRGFPWTDEHQRLLEEAFDASQQQSINARMKEIAARFDWPFHVVDYRLRLLHGKRRAAQRELVVQPSAEENQVEMQPVTVTPEAIEVEQSSPASLLRGPFLWDVRVDGKLQRWQLDVIYGQFSLKVGTHFVYCKREYVLRQVASSMIAVTPVMAAQEPSPEMQLAAV